MSIVTKTANKDTASLMYGRRVRKCHPRVEACGCLDELNTVIGLARATAEAEFVKTNMLLIQQDLVTVMGELSTAPTDLPRYVKDGFSIVTSQFTRRLNGVIQEIETTCVSFQKLEDFVKGIASGSPAARGWAIPGANVSSATLDMARAVCRRAERCVWALQEADELINSEITTFLNRLADLLWIMARWVETKAHQRDYAD